MRTKTYRIKQMADFQSANKNCIESVEKTHATENEKKLLAIVILFNYKSKFNDKYVFACRECLF